MLEYQMLAPQTQELQLTRKTNVTELIRYFFKNTDIKSKAK
jgi:hypothetical protein